MARSSTSVIVIVGPTGSGKTALSLKIAEEFGGEIICADSRTVYKGLDIGTAKPTVDEQARAPHHLLDIVEPNETFTAADFQRQARKVIMEIRWRGNVPIIVGGTGLYIDSLIFDYKFAPKPADITRGDLKDFTIEELQEYCIKNSIELPQNSLNKRYLIRAIEQKGVNHQRSSEVLEEFIVVGIHTDKNILRPRLELRAENMFKDNVVNEASKVASVYGWNSEAMKGNVYPLLKQVISEEITLLEAKHKFVTLDWRLAKRQMTWFKRNPSITWLSYDDAYQYIRKLLGDRHEQ